MIPLQAANRTALAARAGARPIPGAENKALSPESPNVPGHDRQILPGSGAEPGEIR